MKYTNFRFANANAEGAGVIEVRSPSLMKSYFRNPDATANAFTANGYRNTGDLDCFAQD